MGNPAQVALLVLVMIGGLYSLDYAYDFQERAFFGDAITGAAVSAEAQETGKLLTDALWKLVYRKIPYEQYVKAHDAIYAEKPLPAYFVEMLPKGDYDSLNKQYLEEKTISYEEYIAAYWALRYEESVSKQEPEIQKGLSETSYILVTYEKPDTITATQWSDAYSAVSKGEPLPEDVANVLPKGDETSLKLSRENREISFEQYQAAYLAIKYSEIISADKAKDDNEEKDNDLYPPAELEGKKGGTPTIGSFSASPLEISKGNEVTLAWAGIKNAIMCSILKPNGDLVMNIFQSKNELEKGEVKVKPEATTTYELKCFKIMGDSSVPTASSKAVVTLKEGADKGITLPGEEASAKDTPAIGMFTATPARISEGQEATLAWNGIKNARGCSIREMTAKEKLMKAEEKIKAEEGRLLRNTFESLGDVEQGSLKVKPEKTTTYAIRCFKLNEAISLKSASLKEATIEVTEAGEKPSGTENDGKSSSGTAVKTSYTDSNCFFFPERCGEAKTAEKKAEEPKPEEKKSETAPTTANEQEKKSLIDKSYCFFFPKKCSGTETKKETVTTGDAGKITASPNKCAGLVGVRSGSEYCDTSAQVVPMKEGGKACSNSYECVSNVCAAGKCIDEAVLKKALCSLGVSGMC